ncbi:MAG: alpha/beta fold hydrolase [Anaerolineae bacterium]
MEVDLELYREEVVLSENPLLRLSVIEVAPEEPIGTILMIHGFGGQAMQWRNQLKAFADRYRVIAPDLRGHHHSDAPHSRYAMTELQNDLDVLLERLNVQTPIILMGHSFGGAIVTEFAHRRPQDVSHLILISTTGEYRLAEPTASLLNLPLTVLDPLQRLFTTRLHARAHVLKNLYHNSMKSWNGWSMFRNLRMPVLVIRGHRDQVYPTAVFEQVAKSIPDAEDVNVGASSHMVMLERADAVIRSMERFLGLGDQSSKSWRAAAVPRKRLALDRPWVQHYEKGVPETLGFPRRPLFRLLRSASRRHGKRPAIQFDTRRITYRELDDEVNRLSNALRSIGVQKETRVMILMPNCPQFVIAYYAVLKAGGIVVSSSPTNNKEELRRQIEDAGAEVLITLTLFSRTTRDVLHRPPLRAVIYTNIKDYLTPLRRALFTMRHEVKEGHHLSEPLHKDEYSWTEIVRRHPATPPRIDLHHDDIAVIQYTGGTTDQPKGVMLTHYALLANTLQTRHWVTGLREGHERVLAVLPFSHVYGMTAAMNVSIALGACCVILSTFETTQVLNTIKKYRPTLFPGVPTMYMAINNAPKVRSYGISSIKACISGAAPLPVEVQEAFEKITRGRLVEGYGLTEAGPVTHANPLNGLRKVGTIGIPVPGTDAKIVSLVDGTSPVETGQIGELAVSGPQIMHGYWGMGEETDRALTSDGWLLTGDVARMDEEGYFQIISRKKEMILAGKYQVYPRDVEEVLYEHPGVKEVAVVGLKRPETPDQRVKAYVVLQRGSTLAKEELITFCKRRLEEYAVPWDIEFRDELPKSFIGKVLRRLLVEEEVHDTAQPESLTQ